MNANNHFYQKMVFEILGLSNYMCIFDDMRYRNTVYFYYNNNY